MSGSKRLGVAVGVADQRRAGCDECAACFYCGTWLGATRHEHDHFPVPKSAGGGAVVAACVACHDLKDRWTLESWDVTALHGAAADLLALGVMPAQLGEPVPACWGAMGRDSRLLWAKVVRMLHEDPAGALREP